MTSKGSRVGAGALVFTWDPRPASGRSGLHLLHWADPGTLYKSPDSWTIVKNSILMNSGGHPRKCVKTKCKIHPLGGPQEILEKSSSGSSKIVKNNQNIVFWPSKIGTFQMYCSTAVQLY